MKKDNIDFLLPSMVILYIVEMVLVALKVMHVINWCWLAIFAPTLVFACCILFLYDDAI